MISSLSDFLSDHWFFIAVLGLLSGLLYLFGMVLDHCDTENDKQEEKKDKAKREGTYSEWSWMNAVSGYHIIEADETYELQEEVNAALKKGWRLSGNMKANEGPKFGDALGLCNEYKQAMQKP